MVVGRVDEEAFDRHQADLGRLRLQLVGGQGADRHLVWRVGELTARRDLLAQAVDDDVLGPDRRLQRQARVDPAVDLAVALLELPVQPIEERRRWYRHSHTEHPDRRSRRSR